MRYLISLLLTFTFYTYADDHDEMYTEAYGDYLYCSAKEELSDSKAEKMFEKWAEAYQEKANSLDDNVTSVMLWPWYTNEEMRGGEEMFFVTHSPTMKEMGEFQVAMWNMRNDDKSFPESPMECKDSSVAFQRIGPSTGDPENPWNFFTVDYWPCKYTENADPVALRTAHAEMAKEHYANGAEGGYRYIYPGAGSPRGEGPDFWVSAASPGLVARGEGIDIFWDKTYGSEAEQERWNHMTCDTNSTWVGWRFHD